MKFIFIIILAFFFANSYSQTKLDNNWRFVGYYNYDEDTFCYQPLYNINSSSKIEVNFSGKSLQGTGFRSSCFGNYYADSLGNIKIKMGPELRSGLPFQIINFRTALGSSYKYEIKDDSLYLYTSS